MGIRTIALTGHRPNKLWGYNLNHPNYAKVATALKNFCEEHGVENLISGMALGFDQLGAQVALDNHIRLIAAVPFQGQESAWPESSQRTFRNILAQADETHIVCEGSYAAWKMQKRNEWMVDHADAVVALWDGTSGGTGNCVNYAIRQDKPIFMLNPNEIDTATSFKTC